MVFQANALRLVVAFLDVAQAGPRREHHDEHQDHKNSYATACYHLRHYALGDSDTLRRVPSASNVTACYFQHRTQLVGKRIRSSRVDAVVRSRHPFGFSDELEQGRIQRPHQIPLSDEVLTTGPPRSPSPQ